MSSFVCFSVSLFEIIQNIVSTIDTTQNPMGFFLLLSEREKKGTSSDYLLIII